MQIIPFITNNPDQAIEIALAFVGFFSLIATITPTKKDNLVVDILVKMIHFFGANFGKSTNKGS